MRQKRSLPRRVARRQVKKSGFTLVELLVVITILGIIGATILVFVKPQELQMRSRDSQRLNDLTTINNVISTTVQESQLSGAALLCNGGTAPCVGKSTDAGSLVRKIDGTGWVKVNTTSQKSANLPTLPLDPTNNSTYHYVYCSDGNAWELNTVFESQSYVSRMAQDGGDENNTDSTGRWEIGSNLNLINPSGVCQY